MRVEKDAVDTGIRHAEQERREWRVSIVEDQCRLPVELVYLDAVLITDGGPEGRRVGGIRNLRAPLQGAARSAGVRR